MSLFPALAPLTPVSNQFRGDTFAPMAAVHPALRESTPIADPHTTTLIRRNALIEEASATGTLLMFGDGASSVVRFLGFDKDPLWQADGDCRITIGRHELLLDSSVIFDYSSEYLISFLSECFTGNGSHYRMDLPPLSDDDQRIHNYNLAVRNFFGALARKPIVGSALVPALEDLQALAEHLLGFQAEPQKAHLFVHCYVQALKLDDFRHRPADIVPFLTWSENTGWGRVYLETFTHCVGMLNHGLIEADSLDSLSMHTRSLLDQSSTMMQYSLATVETLMASFSVDHEDMKKYDNQSAVQQSIMAFQGFLTHYYAMVYGQWPPQSYDNSEHWLTRPIAQRLQDDFGSLYDLLVDDTIHWGQFVDEDKGQCKGPFYLNGDGNPVAMMDGVGFWATTFPFNSFMIQWNEQYDFKPMPHPFVLPPKFNSTKAEESGGYQFSLVPALRESHGKPPKQPSLYDMYICGTNQKARVTPFCKAFINHESFTHIDRVDTHDARLGRWIIVHCMMQMLSRVAVDVQGLRHRHSVEYFLNADLEGCPPWLNKDMPRDMRQGSQDDSWAYIYGKSVTEEKTKGVPGMQKHVRLPRFKIEWQDDGRLRMLDTDGHVVFS